MKAHGKVYLPEFFQFLPISTQDVKPSISRWLKENKRVRFTMSGEIELKSTATGGILNISPVEGSETTLSMETWYKKRTIKQLQTLKAFEAFIFWGFEGHLPAKSEELFYIHQGIMEEANIRMPVPGFSSEVLITCSSPMCTTEIMNRFIEIALNHLSECELSENLIDHLSSDQPFSVLFGEWIKERMIQKDIEDIKNWDEYKTRFQYCEFTFRANTSEDPLERIHIVSRGSDKADIEASWNWIRGRRSIHQKQHNNGWNGILQEFPHLIPKVKRARELAGKKGLL